MFFGSSLAYLRKRGTTATEAEDDEVEVRTQCSQTPVFQHYAISLLGLAASVFPAPLRLLLHQICMCLFDMYLFLLNQAGTRPFSGLLC